MSDEPWMGEEDQGDTGWRREKKLQEVRVGDRGRDLERREAYDRGWV